MKTLRLALIGLAALAMTRSAVLADTISFGDYFFPGDMLGNGFSSVTDGLAPFTVSGAGTGFTVETEGGAWFGQFIRNTTLIYDGRVAGAVTIAFGVPIDRISDLSVQPYDSGAYAATLTAYDGTTVVGSSSYSGFNAPGPEGTVGYFLLSAPRITSITISSSNDADGVAVGGGLGIPETPIWLMMITGLVLTGAMARIQRNLSHTL